MKALLYCCVCVQAMGTSLSHAVDDAAIEAQEGSIDHWIEYYKKERGTVTPAPVVDEQRVSQPGVGSNVDSSGVERVESGMPPTQMPAPTNADH
jgi:hypothetical protein